MEFREESVHELDIGGKMGIDDRWSNEMPAVDEAERWKKTGEKDLGADNTHNVARRALAWGNEDLGCGQMGLSHQCSHWLR